MIEKRTNVTNTWTLNIWLLQLITRKFNVITTLSESDVAELTDVRLEAGVAPHVHLQRVLLVEVARAHCALEIKKTSI